MGEIEIPGIGHLEVCKLKMSLQQIMQKTNYELDDKWVLDK